MHIVKKYLDILYCAKYNGAKDKEKLLEVSYGTGI